MLSQYLVSELFAFLLVFCRIGSAIMLLPGFGEAYIMTRARLFIAVFISIVLAPTLHHLPPVPDTLSVLMYVMISEIMVGIFIGSISRILISTLQIAGSIIAYQSSLASALTPNITQFQGQDSTIGNLLGITAIILIFATNLHHVMLMGLADSYTLFLPGQFPPVADMAQHATRIISSVFTTSLQLSAPHIAIGLTLYLGAGILARLMPNMQIFFIMMAPQLLLSFALLMIVFGAIMTWYVNYFGVALNSFLSAG